VDESGRAQQLAAIRSFCSRSGGAVLFDEPGQKLLDVYAGKPLPLAVDQLVGVEQKRRRSTGEPYLVLRYEDGRELALADVGIAFVPDVRNTGKLEPLPDVVCFRDYATLRDRLKHELFGHPDLKPTQQTVGLVMACIAILDGARAQGFDVGPEEKDLEPYLAELEKRLAGAPRIP
jgi:hypothetical protein